MPASCHSITYVLDGYGGIHPSGSAPSLSNSYYAGYDIARGLSLFFGATGGYWLDGFGAIHAVGNALSSAAMQVPSFGSDIARAIWVAPWGTPNHPQGLILDGYGGLHPFWANGDTQPVQPISPHYTNGTDIARDLVINLDQSGSNPISGYMLDGHGTVWPFGNAISVASPFFAPDLARGITLLPKSTTNYPNGYVLDGWGGLHPFGGAPTVTSYAYWPNWDIARAVTEWTYASTSWSYGPLTSVGGWVLDGWGGLHPFQSAPAVGSGVPWPNWDIARGHAGSSSGSGAR